MDTEVRARLSAEVGAFVSAMSQASKTTENLNGSLGALLVAAQQATVSMAQASASAAALTQVLAQAAAANGNAATNAQQNATSTQAVVKPTQQAASATQQFTTRVSNATQQVQTYNRTIQRTGRFTRIVTGLFAAGAVGLVAYARKAFAASASVSELDGTLVAIAKSTGVAHRELVEASRAIEAMGIEMASARRIATKFAQNNLDLAQAARLARTAQDLAVVSQSNSTATLNRLIHGIMTGNSLVLRNAGVTGMAGQAYADYAKEIGVVATALTPAQRQQAIINMIFREGEAVAGAYEASMNEAGKVLRSFPRIMNNISVAFGNTMNKGFAPVVLAAYDMTKAFAEAINITPKMNKETGEMTTKVGGLTEGIRGLTYIFNLFMTPLQNAAAYMKDFFNSATLTEEQVKRFIASIEPAIPLITALGAAFSGMGAKALIGMTPFGGLANFIPTWVAGIALFILASDEARAALGNLIEAVRPLLPAFLEAIQQVVSVALAFGTVMVDVVIQVVDAIAGFIRALGATGDGAEIFARAVRAILIGLVLVRTGVARTAATFIAARVQAIGAFITTMRTTLPRAITTAKVQIAALRASLALVGPSATVATVAMNGFRVALRLVTNAVRAFLSATGIGIIIVVMSLLVDAFITAMQTSQEFRDKVENVLNAIIGKVADVVNWMIRAANAVNQFFGGAGDLIDEVDWEIDLPPLNTDAWDDLAFDLPSLEDIFGGDIDDTIGSVDDALEDLGQTAQATGSSVDYLAQAMERLEARTKKIRETAKTFGRWSDTVVDFSDEIEKALGEVDYQAREFDKTLADSATTGDELVSSYNSMASAIRSQLSSALNTARQRLQQLQQEFDQFQAKIAGAISGVIDFRAALPQEEDSRVYTGFIKALGDSMGVLENPAESATSFADNLREQANAAADFSKKIRTLLEMGLSKEALEQVINAGYEAGSAIADEIIAGGVTLVDDINEMVKVVNDMAMETGQAGAKQFFQAGLDMGQALVEAIVGRIESERSRIERLIDSIVARLEAIARAEAEAASAAAAAQAARDVQADAGPSEPYEFRDFINENEMDRMETMLAGQEARAARIARASAADAARMYGGYGVSGTTGNIFQRSSGTSSTGRIQPTVVINQENNIYTPTDLDAMNEQQAWYLKAAGY